MINVRLAARRDVQLDDAVAGYGALSRSLFVVSRELANQYKLPLPLACGAIGPLA